VIDTQELERRMRPRAWSHEGFLGPYERLEDVLRADRQTLEELELEPSQLADTLDCLLGARLIDLAMADSGELDRFGEGRDVEKAVQMAVVSVTRSRATIRAGRALPAVSRTAVQEDRRGTPARGGGLLLDDARDRSSGRRAFRSTADAHSWLARVPLVANEVVRGWGAVRDRIK